MSGSLSASLKVSPGMIKLNSVPAVAVWSAMGLAVAGAKFIPVRLKVSLAPLALKPPEFVAHTFTVIVPMLAFPGVPEKVPVLLSKCSFPWQGVAVC